MPWFETRVLTHPSAVMPGFPDQPPDLPGQVTALRLPGGPGTRFDTALFPGCTVPPFYDSLLAKLIV